MYCHKCGTKAPEDAEFCRKCGTKLIIEEQQQMQKQQQTQQYTRNDDKLMAVLSYLGLLWLIPLCTGAYKNSEFVNFHFNQGTMILILAAGWGVISSIIKGIFIAIFFWFPVMSILVNVFIGILSLGLVVLVILGIVDAVKDNTEGIPVIRDIKLFKPEI